MLTLAFSKIWEGTFSPTVFLKRDRKCRKRSFQEKPSSSIKSWVPDQLELVEKNVTFIPALKKMKLLISVVLPECLINSNKYNKIFLSNFYHKKDMLSFFSRRKILILKFFLFTIYGQNYHRKSTQLQSRYPLVQVKVKCWSKNNQICHVHDPHQFPAYKDV